MNLVELGIERRSKIFQDIQECIENCDLSELSLAWRLNDREELPKQLENLQEVLLDLEETKYRQVVNITDNLSRLQGLLNNVEEITNFRIRDSEEISRDINDIIIDPDEMDQIENERFYNLCIDNIDNMNALIEELTGIVQLLNNL